MEMERKVEGLEDRLLRQDQQAVAVAAVVNTCSTGAARGVAPSQAAAALKDRNDPNHDPMMAMLHRMEQKIESLQSRTEGRATVNRFSDIKDASKDPIMDMLHRMEEKIESLHSGTGRRAAVSSFPDPTTMGSRSPAAAAARATAPISCKRNNKRSRTSPSCHPPQPQHPCIDEDDVIALPSKNKDDDVDDDNSDAGVGDGKKKSKKNRINWAKSPHRERLARILHDYWSGTGLALDDTGEPITCHKKYSRKTGVPHTTLFKYLHKDPAKRRVLRLDGVSYGGRGKKPLIDEAGVRFIVAKLNGKAEANNEGFSRHEAIDLIMEHFGISRNAATRQLTRRILPVMMSEGATLRGKAEAASNDHEPLKPGQQLENLGEDSRVKQQPQPRRSIVISGVTSGIGGSLFQYFCAQGHDVVGCGRDHDKIRSLQLQFPHAKLSAVDIADDAAVARWAVKLACEGTGMDVVVVNAEICLEADRDAPAWEVPMEDFDSTIDANVKGVSNMVRHFVPLMIRTRCMVGGAGVGGTFVTVSSGPGWSLDPHCVAYCASKFAIEGIMKSVAMSLPAPLCAVPLSGGREVVTDEGKTSAGTDAGEILQQHKSSPYDNNPNDRGNFAPGDSNDTYQPANVAGSMILRMGRMDNGRSMSLNKGAATF